MNRKNNFLISFTKINEKAEHCTNSELSNYYNIKTGNISVSINYSDNAVLAKSNDENIIILLSGYIYQDDLFDNAIGKYLINKYLKYNKDFVKYLNGSFCLFFANKNSGEVYFATDRLNTRKIFKFSKGKKLIFSTDIKDLPLPECELSCAGLASYLLNGALLNDLTIFEDIKKLERASLHKIEDLKIITGKYWDYDFTNEYESRTESDLTDELHHLYVQSLKRKINGKKNIFISLSGGYDSRGIAVMIKKILNIDANVNCFSYNFGEKLKDTDSDIASQITDNLGFSFKLLNSYKGNLFNTIKNNAVLGQGLAYFSIEWDAWEEINIDFAECSNSILLTGDMHEGGAISIQFHGNIKRALEKVTIYSSEFLKEFRNYINSDMIQNLRESWDTEYNKILKTASNYDIIVNLIDYLYIDQRIPNVMCVARECFQMPFVETITPYYDNDVLDFVRKVPPDLRDDMRLHRMTLKTKYPEIFRIKKSTEHWGKQPNWINEVGTFSKMFIDDINNHESMLDKVISPEKIINSIKALNNQSNKPKDKAYLKVLHKSLNKIIPSYHKFIEILPGGKELTRKAGKYVNPRITYILPKILIQRIFLSRK